MIFLVWIGKRLQKGDFELQKIAGSNSKVYQNRLDTLRARMVEEGLLEHPDISEQITGKKAIWILK